MKTAQVHCPKCGSKQIRVKKKYINSKKITICNGLAILIIFSFLSCNNNQNTGIIMPTYFNKDSTILAIKKDSLYHVIKVEITQDSSINIHLKDPEDAGSDNYFNKHYNLLDNGYIKEVAIFKKNKFLYSSGFHTASTIKEFEDNHVAGGQIYEMTVMIKKNMNDPDSYDHVKTIYNFQVDNTFLVTTEFRGKNAFNATILSSATATMNRNGDILKFSIR